MTSPSPDHEDLADLITWIMDTTRDSGSAIARKIGVSPAAVSNWHTRKRGTGRGPRTENLRALAAAYNIPEDRVFAAAGRKTPGPLTPDAEERILDLYRKLTEAQQQMTETQMRALADQNRQGTQ